LAFSSSFVRLKYSVLCPRRDSNAEPLP